MTNLAPVGLAALIFLSACNRLEYVNVKTPQGLKNIQIPLSLPDECLPEYYGSIEAISEVVIPPQNMASIIDKLKQKGVHVEGQSATVYASAVCKNMFSEFIDYAVNERFEWVEINRRPAIYNIQSE